MRTPTIAFHAGYLLLGTLTLAATAPLQAQLGDRIVRSAKQKVEERKERTRDHLVHRATEPVDSTLERVAAPVDSAVGRAAGGAAATVARIGRSRSAEIDEEADRLIEELAAGGRAELAGISFAAGSDQPEPSSAIHLTALARALGRMEGTLLIEGRAEADEVPGGGRALAKLRAAAVKHALVGEGIEAARLFAVGQAAGPNATVPITVVLMQ